MQGFLSIIKPTGMSSAAVVGKVKRLLKTKKVGHMGTLDPAASGVLTIAVGKATKFFNYFLGKDKVYYAVAEFGVMTDTLDSEGNIISRHDKVITKEDILSRINNFIGEINQIPPIYSAIKINGRKAYELARAGKKVEIEPRKVKIYGFNILEELGENKFAFRIHCSAGTYIRSLLSDLSIALGTIANIPVIIREKCGDFDIQSSVCLSDIENFGDKALIKIEDKFAELKKIIFDEKYHKRIMNGVSIKNDFKIDENQEFLGYLNNDALFGLFICQNGQISCKINLYEGE